MRLQCAGSLILLFIVGLATTAWGDDTSIARELAEQLRLAKQTDQLKDFRIGVKVENGVVWLKGSVKDKQQQQQALTLARQIAGVKLVVNDLEVDTADDADAAQPALATAVTSLPASPPAPTQKLPEGPAVQATQKLPEAPAVQATQAVQLAAQLPEPTSAPHVAAPIEALPVQHARSSVNAVTPANRMQLPARSPNGAAPPPQRRGAPKVTYSQAPVPAPVPSGIQPVQYEGNAVAGGCGVPGCNCGAGSYGSGMGTPMPEYGYGGAGGYAAGGSAAGVSYEQPQLPGHAWPSYAAYPNYGAVTYPKQYSPTAWPYIGPFYPYPQVPMGWRKVSLEWDDGWWFLDFKSK